MNFYKIEIQTMPDDTIAVAPTATYDNSVDAEIAFDNTCAAGLSAVKAGTLKAVLVVVFDSYGSPVFRRCYEAPAVPEDTTPAEE